MLIMYLSPTGKMAVLTVFMYVKKKERRGNTKCECHKGKITEAENYKKIRHSRGVEHCLLYLLLFVIVKVWPSFVSHFLYKHRISVLGQITQFFLSIVPQVWEPKKFQLNIFVPLFLDGARKAEFEPFLWENNKIQMMLDKEIQRKFSYWLFSVPLQNEK